MYFADRAPVYAPQEIGHEALDQMQRYFTAEKSLFQLPYVFETLSGALPDDDQMDEFIAGTHPNSQAVACLQLETYGRQDARERIARRLRGTETMLSKAAMKHIANPDDEPTDVGSYEIFAKRRSTELDYFDPQISKSVAASYPANMPGRDWRNGVCYGADAIVLSVRDAAAANGERHTEADMMQAGLRLVCSRKTVPEQLPIATAPSRISKALGVLCQAGHLYERGVISMSGALSRGGYTHEWDRWHVMAAKKGAKIGQPISTGNRAMMLEDGLAMAIRFDHPHIALQLATDSLALQMEGESFKPAGEPSTRLINGLAIVVHRSFQLPE